MATHKIIIVADKVRVVSESLRALANSRVMVGVPAEKTDRSQDDGGVTNAMIGFFNEHGAPEAGLPARPHLVPGVKSVQSENIRDLKTASLVAMKGEKTKALQMLHRVGLRSQNAVRGKIRAGLQPELSESTLEGRRRRGRTGEKPLWDTGQYLRSITYVIRNIIGWIK